ncbi:hypothetical protein K1719_007525 [Acacia pycnantha]|nr:hypothetical protein K1719_007525 [Acacia pycnantha]
MQLVYEGLHSVCFGCGTYGHERDKCPHSPGVVDGVNREHERSSVADEKGRTSGHSEQSMSPVSGNMDDPNHKAMEEMGSGGNQNQGVAANGGAGLVDEVSGGETLAKGGAMAATATAGLKNSKAETPQSVPGIIGGSKHLGPQMILRRDLRRNNYSMVDIVGVKSGSPDWVQGVKKGGVNGGTSNVGSKRKKEERPKAFGKENISVGKLKSKQKEVTHSGLGDLTMSNGFASLHDVAQDDTSLMHGAMQVDVTKEGIMGNYNLNAMDPALGKSNDTGEISIDLANGDIHAVEKNEAQGAKSFPSLVRELKKHYKLDFLAILETRSDSLKSEQRIRSLGFSNFSFTAAEEYSGGIWCHWEEVSFKIQIEKANVRCIGVLASRAKGAAT